MLCVFKTHGAATNAVLIFPAHVAADNEKDFLIILLYNTNGNLTVL